MLAALPQPLYQWFQADMFVNFANSFLPFFSIGFGWVVPALIGFIVGLTYEDATTTKLVHTQETPPIRNFRGINGYFALNNYCSVGSEIEPVITTACIDQCVSLDKLHCLLAKQPYYLRTSRLLLGLISHLPYARRFW